MPDIHRPTPVILVVDDDHDILPFLIETLRTLTPYAIEFATNGLEALERYDAVHPDCVLIDVKMPILDGVQVVRALRGDPASAETPIVILTAMAQDKDRFAGMAAGADQYLVKPVEPRTIVTAIDRALHLTETTRDDRLRQMTDDFSARG